MATGLTPLPTTHTHSTQRLTHAEAHTFLSSFLERADVDAAYRPDATLTERGPQALSSGSTPNLTLSHLKRILQGIEGKRVGGQLKLGGAEDAENEDGVDETEDVAGDKRRRDHDEGADVDDERPKPKKSRRTVVYDPADDPEQPILEAAPPDDRDGNGGDWQDAQTYALQQSELPPGVTFANDTDGIEVDEEEVTNVQAEGGDDDDADAARKLSRTEKEERKLLKKMRQKGDKAKRAEKRQEGKKGETPAAESSLTTTKEKEKKEREKGEKEKVDKKDKTKKSKKVAAASA